MDPAFRLALPPILCPTPTAGSVVAARWVSILDTPLIIVLRHLCGRDPVGWVEVGRSLVLLSSALLIQVGVAPTVNVRNGTVSVYRWDQISLFEDRTIIYCGWNLIQFT